MGFKVSSAADGTVREVDEGTAGVVAGGGAGFAGFVPGLEGLLSE